MMTIYLRLLLKLLYKGRRKRRRPLSYIVALNVLTMTITDLFNLATYILVCVNLNYYTMNKYVVSMVTDVIFIPQMQARGRSQLYILHTKYM